MDALPPRTLAAGECGLFGWARDTERFVFFSGEAAAEYVFEGQIVSLTPDGAFPATSYAPGVTLKLGTPVFLDGGQRFPDARLVLIEADGFERIQPLVAIASCVD